MNIYQTLYDLLAQYVFNGNVITGSYQDMILIIISTMGWLFLVFLPFILVWKFLKLL